MLGAEAFQEYEQKWNFSPLFGLPPKANNVTIRRVTIEDAHHILEMHQRLSRDSVFSRYLRMFTPTLKQIEDVCLLEENEGFVLVATTGNPVEKIVGIAYYCVDPENSKSAEPAILVEDDYQGYGVGKHLLDKLFQNAAMLGVTEFNCYADPSNNRVLRMIERSGMRFECRFIDGTNEIRVWLDPDPS